MSNARELLELKGQVIVKIDKYEDEILLYLVDGSIYKMFHKQDCCESVYIEDIVGDLNDLLGSPLTMAEEVSNADDPPDIVISEHSQLYKKSYTWTFYKFATVKGYVTVRWYGTSNGYYSESATIKKTHSKWYV